MSTRHAFAAVLTLTLLFAGLAAPKSSAQGVRVGIIYHHEPLPPAGASFVVNCPPGWFAFSGHAAPNSDPRFFVISSSPGAAATTWSFVVGSLTTTPITASVTVVCVGPPIVPPPPPTTNQAAPPKSPPQVVLVAPQPNNTNVVIDHFSVGTGKTTCPKGTSPVGEGFNGTPVVPPKKKKKHHPQTAPKIAHASAIGRVGAVEVTSIMPSGRSILFGFRNPTAADEQVRITASCLQRKVRVGRGTEKIRVKQAFFDTAVQPGDQLVSGHCSGGVILDVGFSLPLDGSVSLFGVDFRRDGVGLSLGNHSLIAEPAKVALVCAPGKVKFVREG